MNRLSRTDKELDALNEERDHVAIQISLLRESENPDAARLSTLELKLASLELSISRWKSSFA